MQLMKVKIHNFRSIEDAEFNMIDYSMLIGENNDGKTNILTALRIFYDNNIKFDKNVDLPKFKDIDNKSKDFESWIEISYKTTSEEQDDLDEKYRSDDSILKVRKYLHGLKVKPTATNSNIYGYEGGKLSENQFYGAKNFSQAKLGEIIFIPPISKSEEALKTSGPSPFREMVNHIMKKTVFESNSFTSLQSEFNNFNDNFKGEVSEDGLSINALVNDINSEINEWGVECGISINPIKPEDIVKSLLDFIMKDKKLNEDGVEISSFGQGLQRHLIFTLIKMSSKFGSKKPIAKKEKVFDPDFTLIIYEEPEAFLHPSKQKILHLNLNKLAAHEASQVLISSHSPHFVSKHMEKIQGIIKLQKDVSGRSNIFQISEQSIKDIMDKNLELGRDINTAMKSNDPEGSPDEEFIRYSLWLDSERSSMFFAKQVIICEGATERSLLDLLCDTENGWENIRDKHVYFLDAMGKYNMHRYMHLLTGLGIHHSVLYDKDKDNKRHNTVNKHIEDNKSELTHHIYGFDKDFETFLGVTIPKKTDGYKKPVLIVSNYQKGMISSSKINELKEIINSLVM